MLIKGHGPVKMGLNMYMVHMIASFLFYMFFSSVRLSIIMCFFFSHLIQTISIHLYKKNDFKNDDIDRPVNKLQSFMKIYSSFFLL